MGSSCPWKASPSNHHFLLPEGGTDFRLLTGDYTLRVFAKKVSVNMPEELASVHLRISEAHAHDLNDENAGIDGGRRHSFDDASRRGTCLA